MPKRKLEKTIQEPIEINENLLIPPPPLKKYINAHNELIVKNIILM